MDTHQKVYTFQKFISVLITFVGINYEEMVLRTNPPSMINHMSPSLFLELVIIYP